MILDKIDFESLSIFWGILSLNFFPFSDYDLKNFDNIIFDLNRVFKGKMLLQRNEIISSILNTNEVLISSSKYEINLFLYSL